MVSDHMNRTGDAKPIDGGRPRVVILLENLPIARDRRVWREAIALRDAGVAVTAICPKDPGDPDLQTVDGIEVRSFRAPPERSSALGFMWEYLVAWVQMLRLLIRTRREHGIDAVQVCNPPDIFFAHGHLAHAWGVPFVFDQHDLTPELYETRFGAGGLVHAILRWCERRTYGVADRVIATNQSYRAAAIERGGLAPESVVIVRNGPDPDTMAAGPPDPALKQGFEHLVVWMGNMGPQDGVDDAVRSVAHLIHGLGRRDCHVVFIGKGEVLDDLRSLALDLDVTAFVTFTGWIPDDEAFRWLSTADVGLSADPPGPLNDKSTMNKTLEYMAFGLPVVAHDLTETRFSAGAAGAYATTGDPEGLARCLDELLEDPERMKRLGRCGRDRIEFALSWPHQRSAYIDLWRDVLGLPPTVIDLRDRHQLETGANRCTPASATKDTNR